MEDGEGVGRGEPSICLADWCLAGSGEQINVWELCSFQRRKWRSVTSQFWTRAERSVRERERKKRDKKGTQKETKQGKPLNSETTPKAGILLSFSSWLFPGA